jgi:hypothetical protein
MEEKPDDKKTGLTQLQKFGVGFVVLAIVLTFIFEAEKLSVLFTFLTEVIAKLIILG